MKLITKILMPILILGSLSDCPVFAKDEENPSKEINIHVVSRVPNRNRSIIQFAGAVYHLDMSLLDIVCYGAKETLIYIVDQTGDVVSSDTFDFSLSPNFSVDAPVEKGQYWLVLDSAELYAEGMFRVD